MNGDSPYDQPRIAREFTDAGGLPEIAPDPVNRPAVYFITAFPIVATVSWLPWNQARLAWCILSVVALGFSLASLLRRTTSDRVKQVLLGSAALAFSPVHTGLALGNPTVLCVSLIVASVTAALGKRSTLCGIFLGAACCIKPQLAICAGLALLLWREWKAVIIAVATAGVLFAVAIAPAFPTMLSSFREQRANISGSSLPGGVNDPSLANVHSYHLLNGQALTALWIGPGARNDGIVLLVAIAGLLTCFVARRLSPALRNWKTDVAVLAVATLFATYHRYYDASLLVFVLPLLADGWSAASRRSFAVALFCIALVAFPTQSAFARYFPEHLHPRTSTEFLEYVLLFRHQPAAIATLAAILASVAVRARAPLQGTAAQRIAGDHRTA